MSKHLIIFSLFLVLFMSAGVGILVQKLPSNETIIMPDLTNHDVNDTEKLLHKLYPITTNIKIDSIYSDYYSRNTIVLFSPKAGTRITPKTKVSIVYACGRKTCPKCQTLRKKGERVCRKCGYVFE